MTNVKCKHCNSTNITKKGYRLNKSTNTKIQRFRCKDCKGYFSSEYVETYSEELKDQVIKCHNSRMSSRAIGAAFIG